MKNSIVALPALLACSISIASLAHADVSVRTRAGVATGHYSVSGNVTIKGNQPNTVDRSVDYQSTYTAVPIGLTLISDTGLYFDLLHQSSSGSADFAWSGQSPHFMRDETTLTIGGRIENVSVYMGYKVGETNTDWPSPYTPDKFSSTGFVAGLGWVLPLRVGAINLGAGIGLINGRYSFTSSSSIDSTSTLGYSLGAGYNYTVNQHFSMAADFKWQSYNYQFRTPSAASLREELSQLTLTAAYSF